ncbi:hypothetical protein C1645_819249 [Glomus cerebriforme]|uniref:Uncharacterized protein n=1 Tax=Glomus cerebriforme TaxID=658196 RepID=A0A397T6N1_9GLOM|nr:hypothetical protein C1645_819249 [Glomus cerebriforme]
MRPSDIYSDIIKVFWIATSNVVQVEKYKNFSNHTHSLSEIDRLKRLKAIKSLVEIEAAKNYSPLTITSVVKEYATLELGLGEPMCELKRKEVANIKYKVRSRDIVSKITVSPNSLPETNWYDWHLFTLYVHDTYGCWNVGAHFFVSNHSNIEVKSIKKTFSGMVAGAIHKVVNIDCKNRSEAESASFDFCIKRISAYGVDDDILEEIQKFPFPFQQLIIKEACAMMNRLEN